MVKEREGERKRERERERERERKREREKEREREREQQRKKGDKGLASSRVNAPFFGRDRFTKRCNRTLCEAIKALQSVATGHAACPCREHCRIEFEGTGHVPDMISKAPFCRDKVTISHTKTFKTWCTTARES